MRKTFGDSLIPIHVYVLPPKYDLESPSRSGTAKLWLQLVFSDSLALHNLLKLRKNLPRWIVKRAVKQHPTGTLLTLALKNRELDLSTLRFIVDKYPPPEVYATLLETQTVDEELFNRILARRESFTDNAVYVLDVALLKHPLCPQEIVKNIFMNSSHKKTLYPFIIQSPNLAEEEKIELYLRFG